MPTTDVVLDDGGLLLDRVLRSLHKAGDGHLSANARHHIASVLDVHNVAVLYVYTLDSGAHMLHEHYIYSHQPLSYKQWYTLVIDECIALRDTNKHFYGVYGWLTSYLSITPLRTGDLFIKIDREGAKGVRLSFGTKEDKQGAYSKKKI